MAQFKKSWEFPWIDKVYGFLYKNVDNVVLENAPQNAKYTLLDIQKDILHVFATNVQLGICDKIGKENFCLTIDESQNEY